MTKSLSAVFFAVVLLLSSGLAHAGGTIVGVIRYDGEVPLAKRRPVLVDADVCGPVAVTQDLILGKKGAVQGVVVSLEGGFEGVVRPLPPPGGYVLDEKQCRFNPHVVVVPAGSDLKILNSDHLNHFYRVESRTNPPTSVALPKSASSATLHLDFPEVVELRCDIHEAERARIVVSRHPYVAVTDEEGRFEIKDVPVGDFTILFWQEALGSTNRRVQVREGEATRVDIILGPRKQSSFRIDRIDVNVLPILTVR